MQKENLDTSLLNHYYDQMALKKLPSIFRITLPITLIQKSTFTHVEAFVKERFDLLHSEVDVLASLYTHNNELTPTQLYDLTIFSSGGMTKILKRLEQRKLISRKPDLNDKRCMLVCLSDKGEKLILEIFEQVAQKYTKFFDVLDGSEKEVFAGLLKKVLFNIDSVECPLKE